MCKYYDICPVCNIEKQDYGVVRSENCNGIEPDYKQCIPLLIEACDWCSNKPYNPEIYRR